MSTDTASTSTASGIELRKVVEFETYKQFNTASTHKSKLASLCVSLKSCVTYLQEESTTINKVILNADTQYVDTEAQLEAIKEARVTRHTKVSVILEQVWKARNEKFEKKLPEFKVILDLFKNITETDLNTESESDGIDSLENLKSQLDEYVDKLNEKDVTLGEAQMVARVAEEKLRMAEQKIRQLEQKVSDCEAGHSHATPDAAISHPTSHSTSLHETTSQPMITVSV